MSVLESERRTCLLKEFLLLRVHLTSPCWLRWMRRQECRKHHLTVRHLHDVGRVPGQDSAAERPSNTLVQTQADAQQAVTQHLPELAGHASGSCQARSTSQPGSRSPRARIQRSGEQVSSDTFASRSKNRETGPLPEPGRATAPGRTAQLSRSEIPSARSSRAARRAGARRTPKGRGAGGCDPVAINYPVLAAFPPCACLV